MLWIACCGQTTETDGSQTGQASSNSQAKGIKQATTPQPQDQRFPYAPVEVLVKFKPGTDPTTIARIQTELKLETIRRFSSPNLFLMKITDDTTVEAMIKRLKAYEAVKYAEPNYGVKTTQ
jgi:hypothetical protein